VGEDLIILPYKFGDIMKKCNQCKKTKPFSEFYKCNRGNVNEIGGYRYICKFCDNIKSNKRKKNNNYKRKKKITLKHAKRNKINSQKHRTEMSDMYIRSLMTKKFKGLDSKDIPDELVQLHRASLQLKRKLLEDSKIIRNSNDTNNKKGW